MLTPWHVPPPRGTTFAIEVEGGDPVALTLDEVQTHGHGHEHRAEPFTLLFVGPIDVGRYEAVFNS